MQLPYLVLLPIAFKVYCMTIVLSFYVAFLVVVCAICVFCLSTHSVINAMTAALVFVNVVSVAMLAVAELEYEDTAVGSRLNKAVVLLQVVALCCE